MFQQSFKSSTSTFQSTQERVELLLNEMTLAEKIGQMSQVNGGGHHLPEQIRAGKIGSVINEVNVELINEFQRLAMEESRLGIPLLIGRDVIHGFKTIFPIPLGQAASWNPDLVKHCAHISALEASSSGINWTFAPMIDITRDPRWGRIAESLGEDPYLCSTLGAAMIQGFQGEHMQNSGSIAACAKHFAGYGAVESGLDYNTTNIPENELRNVYLPPFKAAVESGAATFMAAFSDLNGIPATANEWLLTDILRKEWAFKGLVVSDWESISELTVHGIATDSKDAAFQALQAGVDMEMASTTYAQHIEALLNEKRITQQQIDKMVSNILTIKFDLGLFENPYRNPSHFPAPLNTDHLHLSKQAALESCVLLKNNDALPLSFSAINSIAVIGPLADQAKEQLGTWVFDGDSSRSITPLIAIGDFLTKSANETQTSRPSLNWAPGLISSRDHNTDKFADAVTAAEQSDVAVMFVGEEAILSGEAHCRANIDLPGQQEQLIKMIAATNTPIVLVVMAGRPLTLSSIIDQVDAVLYAWHPGTMAGPAITDLLFGIESPSGKLPVSFPRLAGQIPTYYARKNTGRPANDHNITHIDDIDGNAEQTSLGMSSFHLDAGYKPLFCFGYGQSYSRFEYDNIAVSSQQLTMSDSITITANLSNIGNYDAEEVVQLYIRDLVGNVTRPIKELKGFQKHRLKAGEKKTISFTLHTDDFAFYNRNMQKVTEPGDFHVWIGGDSETQLRSEFKIITG
jgi:beta-glucosidase